MVKSCELLPLATALAVQLIAEGEIQDGIG